MAIICVAPLCYVVKRFSQDAQACFSSTLTGPTGAFAAQVLLSVLAEGCEDPSCDWTAASFTTANIAALQARINSRSGSAAERYL